MSTKAVLISLFWAPVNSLLGLLEMHFDFPFNLIGKSTMTFLTDQSWRVPKSWYTGGDPEQGFEQTDLTKSLVLSVAQAIYGFE